MSDTLKEVIAKIQKLLKLSESKNHHEAALATAKAAELMLKYQIQQMDLNTEDSDQAELNLSTYTLFENPGKNRAIWKEQIAFALGSMFGCCVYLSNNGLKLYGSQNDSQTVTYLFLLICREVDAYCDELWMRYGQHQVNHLGEKFHGKTWKSSFRLGCVTEISNRLRAKRKDIISEQSSNSHALVVINKKAELVNTWMRNSTKPLETKMNITSMDAYNVGKMAGKKINLGDQADGRLSAPSTRLVFKK